MIKISKDHAALFVKKLDAGSNYGYIVQDALYSESRPDFDDALDYYEYEDIESLLGDFGGTGVNLQSERMKNENHRIL